MVKLHHITGYLFYSSLFLSFLFSCLLSFRRRRRYFVRSVRTPTAKCCGGLQCRPPFCWWLVSGRWKDSKTSSSRRNWSDEELWPASLFLLLFHIPVPVKFECSRAVTLYKKASFYQTAGAMLESMVFKTIVYTVVVRSTYIHHGHEVVVIWSFNDFFELLVGMNVQHTFLMIIIKNWVYLGFSLIQSGSQIYMLDQIYTFTPNNICTLTRCSL